jgi:dipeptidyl aminopeptidase/acylaminoacyl peptidase
MKRIHLSVLFVLLILSGCRHEEKTTPTSSPKQITVAQEFASARKSFVTKLKVRGPAPQMYHSVHLPAGVQQVEYTSGDLKLKGWLSADPSDGKQHPAVVFLHGGWAFAADDWQDAAPFAEAGFVLFMPTLRGENGNPGAYESFYGEVDDAIAAGRYVATLPHVDSGHVFVIGHSVGAVLTCLTSMMPSPYKAAAALDGYVDMENWTRHAPHNIVPYDQADPKETYLRNPMAFVESLQCPLTLYVAADTQKVNEAFAAKAVSLGKFCDLVMVRGDHQAMVAPAVKQAIDLFRQAARK